MKLVFIKALIRGKTKPSGISMVNNGNVDSSNDQPEKIEDMLMHMKVENQKILDEMENHFNKTSNHLFPES